MKHYSHFATNTQNQYEIDQKLSHEHKAYNGGNFSPSTAGNDHGTWYCGNIHREELLCNLT